MKKATLVKERQPFDRLQLKVLGYIQFQIRSCANEWCVDSYTRNGKLITTKLHRIPTDVVLNWIREQSEKLRRMQRCSS